MLKTKKAAEQVSIAVNANSLFKSPIDENKAPHCAQNINVTVNIDQKDDVLTSCFKSIASIFKKR